MPIANPLTHEACSLWFSGGGPGWIHISVVMMSEKSFSGGSPPSIDGEVRSSHSGLWGAGLPLPSPLPCRASDELVPPVLVVPEARGIDVDEIIWVLPAILGAEPPEDIEDLVVVVAGVRVVVVLAVRDREHVSVG